MHPEADKAMARHRRLLRRQRLVGVLSWTTAFMTFGGFVMLWNAIRAEPVQAQQSQLGGGVVSQSSQFGNPSTTGSGWSDASGGSSWNDSNGQDAFSDSSQFGSSGFGQQQMPAFGSSAS